MARKKSRDQNFREALAPSIALPSQGVSETVQQNAALILLSVIMVIAAVIGAKALRSNQDRVVSKAIGRAVPIEASTVNDSIAIQSAAPAVQDLQVVRPTEYYQETGGKDLQVTQSQSQFQSTYSGYSLQGSVGTNGSTAQYLQ